MGRPRKYATAEEAKEANRARARQYVMDHKEAKRNYDQERYWEKCRRKLNETPTSSDSCAWDVPVQQAVIQSFSEDYCN